MSDEQKTKWCGKGQHAVPVEYFAKDSRSKDGLQSRCNDCIKAHYSENKTKILERHKQYRRDNAERLSASKREKWAANRANELPKKRERFKVYYHANTDKFAERRITTKNYTERYNKGYYKQNRERILNKVKDYARANPKIVTLCSQNRRARERAAQGSFTYAQWLAKCSYWGWRCYLCGCSLNETSAQIEHRKPLSRGGTNWIANIAPACRLCNQQKHAKTEAEYKRSVG